MTKEIIIDGRAVAMKSSAYLPLLYNDLFSTEKSRVDFFADMQNVVDKDGNIVNSAPIMRVGYAMAVHANDDKETTTFKAWLEEFSLIGFMESLGDIYMFWATTSDTKSTAKKKSDPPNGK